MASFIKQYQANHQVSTKPTHDTSNNAEDLKLKMKLLEQQIEALQRLKSKQNANTEQNKPPKSQNPSKINQKTSNQAQNQITIPIQPLKLGNLKSDKVTQLVTQIHAKSTTRSRIRKLSIQRYAETQRQTVNNIKETLQKIDISSGRKKKKAGVNVYELKGLKHNVDSNIFNVTIAEIMTEEHQKYQLVKEIKRLKDKLKHLQVKKLQNQQKRKKLDEENQQEFNYQQQEQGEENYIHQQEEDNNDRRFMRTEQRRRIISNIELPFQTSSTTRKGSTLTAGRIYSRSRVLINNTIQNHQDESSLNNSRTTQELISTHRHSIQLRRNSNPLTWNPQVSLEYNGQKKLTGEIVKTHRTINYQRGSGSIDVKKGQGDASIENNSTSRNRPFFKLGNNKKQIVKQFTSTDKQQSVDGPQSQASQSAKQQAFETSKHPQISIKLVPQLKINKLKQPQPIPQTFIPNFRNNIKSKLLSITLPPQPSEHQTQSQLQTYGRILFTLFDIYVQDELKNKSAEYKVTKYKNCVLYRINDEKNIVWYYDGRFYFGGWEINMIGEGKKEGFGVEIVPNQYMYQGYYSNNKRDGYGIMVNKHREQEQKNVIYEGYWKEGHKHGKGYQAQPDLEYLGDFQAGIQTGHCKIKTQTTYYQGQIKESIKQGVGHQILKNGDQYHGQFQSNMFHGLGEYKWKSGAYFYGNFVKGIRKGQGIWISSLMSENFDIYKGSYEQNKKNGFGMYQWANGTIYEGYFKNDLRHDEGLMKYPNGKAAKFMWRDGNKANKLYSKEEEEYRCNRNSAIKISQTNEQIEDENSGEEDNVKFQNVFREQILKELNTNTKLMLFRKSN